MDEPDRGQNSHTTWHNSRSRNRLRTERGGKKRRTKTRLNGSWPVNACREKASTACRLCTWPMLWFWQATKSSRKTTTRGGRLACWLSAIRLTDFVAASAWRDSLKSTCYCHWTSYKSMLTCNIFGRIQNVGLFVKAISQPTCPNLNAIRMKEIFRLEEIEAIFRKWVGFKYLKITDLWLYFDWQLEFKTC